MDFLFIGLLLIIDAVSKHLALAYLSGNGAFALIPGILGLRYVTNTGAAFSFLSGGTAFLIIFTGIGLAVIAYLLFIKRIFRGFEKFAMLLIFRGGVGNLIDRVLRGYVVDFFEFLFMKFAVFNVADVYVCAGVALYIVAILSAELLKKGEKSEKDISVGQ